jgi:hypothetical protein
LLLKVPLPPLDRTQAPRTSTQAETATNNGNGSVTTVNWGATHDNRNACYRSSEI